MKEQLSIEKAFPNQMSVSIDLIERMATDPRVDPGKLREILAVKQSWEADEARKAFAADMAIFQSKCPIVHKGDNANGKMYARIDRIHSATRRLREDCGFWFLWSSCEVSNGMAVIAGMLGHRNGHTVELKQTIPLPDEIVTRSGGKVQNDTQRAGSAMTYAKRYGECLALGIVTGDDNDANNSQPARPVAQATEETRRRMIAHFEAETIQQEALGYAIDKAWIMPDGTLHDWPLDHIPVTKGQLKALIDDILSH